MRFNYLRVLILGVAIILTKNGISATYYSQASSPFSILTNWNTIAGGGGANPIAADLTSGTHTFVIQNTHNVVVDQDISVAALTVGSGASGSLTIGNAAIARNITIAGNLSVNTGANINVGSFNAVHMLTVGGNISNAGTISMVNTAVTRVCNTILNGAAFPQILGTATPTFNDLTISAGASGADITRAISVFGNFLVTNNTPLTTAQSSTITGSFTITNGSTFTASGGTMTFNNATSQTIDVNNATFMAMTFSGSGTKNVLGSITATGLVTIGVGVTLTDAGAAHVFSAGLTINNAAVLDLSGTVNFAGNLTTGYDFNIGNTTNMGTASWTFTNTVTTLLTGGATSGQFTFAGDLTINAGTTTFSNNTGFVSSGTSLSLNGTSVLVIAGLTKPAGITNFPTGFSTYTLAAASTVRYNMAGNQIVSAGTGIVYGNLQLTSATKTVSGSPLIMNGALTLNTVTADLSGVDVTLGGSITAAGACTLSNDQTFTLDGNNVNQTIGAGATYNFNNLVIAQSNVPTASRTKTIATSITVDGNFTTSNTGGSNILLNIIDLQSFTLLDGSPSGTFQLGSNVQLNVSGTTASEFQTTLNNFTIILLDDTYANQSRVRFNNAVAGTTQIIPFQNTTGLFSYGNIELAGSGGAGNTKQAGGSLDINGNLSYSGGTVVFNDGNFNHSIAGDWLIWSTIYTTPGATCTITFDGTGPQYIGFNTAFYQFRNIVIANTSGLFSINFSASYTLTILGDLTINSGANLDASNRNIAIGGNWLQLGTAVFTQTATTTFNGTTANQTINIATPSTSYFGNFAITKTAGVAPQTVTALTDMNVNGNFTFTNNQATFDATNVTVKVAGNWTFSANTTFISTGSTIHFSGNGTQTITNTATTPTFNNIQFSGTGTKTFSNNAILVNGNIDITGANVAWGGATILTLMGNWVNTGGTGTFIPSTGTVLLNGAAQNIGAAPFYNLTTSGTGGSTKTLTANVALNNALVIGANTTLDVSPSNYTLSVGGNWTNSGAFSCGTGTVNLTGANATIVSGTAAGPATGFNFYNLTINKTTSANTAIFGAGSDMVVLNNLTISVGTLALQTSADAYIAGNFINSDIFTVNNIGCQLNFTASSGTKTFDPGTSVSNSYRNIIVNATGATYQLANNLLIANAGVLTISGGTFQLNGKVLSLTGAAIGTTVVAVGAGTLYVDAGATLRLSDQTIITINNASSVFKVVGSASNYAGVTTNSTGATGYTINQSNGVFHAKYYTFSNLRTTGITLSGSTTIDPVNNFSNGTFTSPASTGLTQYIDVSGIALGTLSPVYTVFNLGTAGSKNVKASAGTTGYIEFTDPSGGLQGAANETDDGVAATGKVRWAYNGYFWTDAGNDGDWFNVLNWNVGALPTASDNAYIDHTIKAGAFSNPVTVNAAGAVCNNLTINAGGATAITLSLTASGVLTANGNVSIFTNNILTFSGAGVFNVKGAFSYTGAASTPAAGTVAMIGTSGSNIISSGNYQFYNLTVNAAGVIYTLGTAIIVNNDVTISNGTLDVSGSNLAITAKGDWTVNGGGVFTPQAGTVTLSKSGTSTQTITGGNFYNLTLDNATAATTAVKSLTSSCTVLGSVIIGGTGISQFNTSTYDLYVAGSWTNNSTSGLSSNATVYFNGITGTQTIAGTQATIFNHLTLSGAAVKNINFNQQVNGDMQLSTTSGTVTLAATAVITDGGASNTLTIAGATTFVVLATFPTVFETISLSAASVVRYQANGAQTIYSVASPGYGTLQLFATTAGTATTKTSLGDLFLQTGITLGNGGTDNNVTLNMNNFNMNLAGVSFVQQTGAPQVSWGTGTMTQSGGAWNIDADITGFNNLVLAGTGAKLMLGNLNLITGNVTVQNGTTLNMQTFTLTCIGASKILTLQSGGTLISALTASIAFPTGFTTYTLDPASTVTLNGAGNQTAQCMNVTYGILNFVPTVAATVSLNTNLLCTGDFSMNNNATLVDGGFNMNFSGANIDIRTYTPTISTSTITLSGAAQTFCNANNGGTFTVGNVIFGGTASSVKTLGSRPGAANTVYLSGTIVINNTIVVNCARNLFYTGPSWTNNGNYNHTGGLYTFSGSAFQTINPGVTNTYNSVAVSNTNNPGVLITTNGMNITTTTVINANARFDMGGSAAPAASITHTFGGAVTNNGYWTTANAHLIFNGGTTPIPVNDAVTPVTTFTARNVTIGAGTKTLAATTTWQVDNLTINAGSAFNPGAAANTLNVKGDWTCNGTFTHNNNTVNFNGNGGTNAAAVNITAGNSAFFLVNYAPTGSAVSYTLQSATTTIQSDMTLGSLATLTTNAKILVLGRNAAAIKTYTINGVLNVDANSTLSFDNRGSATAGVSQCVMTVTGGSAKLKILGSSSAAVATLTAVTGGTQAAGYYTAITITAGAEIQARYYIIQYLADAGMVVTNTAVINNTNNFSDGAWAFMNTTGTGAATRYYLDCEAPAPAGTIANVAFNYNVTPIPANRFNVKRTAAATTLQFVDVISGTLGGYLYESDDLSATTGRITWPATTTANWIGAVSSNFNDGLNWSSGAIPNANTDCIIGAVVAPNVSPVIDVTSGAAVCKLLTITNGRLDFSGGVAGVDLDVKGSISIGTTGAGILNVSNADVTIQVGGSWTRGAIAGTSFIHGNGTVSFNATSGSFTIDPKITGNYAFGNIVFNGATSSYTATGGLTAVGNFTINDATFIPTSGITVNIGGDYTNTNGIYTATPSNTSTTVLNRSGAQSIANATFYNLTVSGSGVKTFSGNSSIYNNVTVNAGTTLRAPAGVEVLTMGSSNNGNMTISSGGTFDDNGGSHYFNGAIWTATTASYTGSGTMTFNRTAGQSLTGGQFNNLNLTTAGNVTVSANVIVNANIDVNLSLGGILILNNNFSITGGGLGVFTLGAGQQLNVNGTSNCPSGFIAYAFDPTSTTNYTQLFNQVIGPITYGNLFLNTATVKTLAGDIVVLGTLTINNATLDVSSNNYDVTVAGNFNNNGTGSFLSNGSNHAGELIINGSGTQNIYIGNSGSKSIYNLTINKTVGSVVNVQTTNINILNNLMVQSGIFSLNGLTGNIGGDMNITSSNGSISQSGTFNMIATTGNRIIQLKGSNLNNVIINASGITYTAQDNISVYGNFTLTAGTFDGNGKYVNLGNTGGRTISVAAGTTYKIGAGGTLALGNTAAMTVNGTIEIIGSISTIAAVTKTATGGSYNFDVNGTIKAQYYLFEYMTAAGISINASATIDPTYGLSDGTFTNGPANCKYLTISNTQTLTINNVIFPFTPTGSANNVVKATAGVVTFYNATGAFAGASFEGDDGSASTGAIRWTGAETLTWIGAVSTDWYVAGNWSSSLGGNGVPDATKNAIIAINGPNRNPTIDGSGGSAQCKNLTINSTMILTLNTPAGISDLKVNGDIQISGEIKTTSNNDYIEVTGNWAKIAAGTVNLTNGTVLFTGAGSKTINNGTGTFKNLTINNAGGSYLLGANTTVNGDLTITAGSLDVSGSFYSLTVKGNWINSGTFIARTGSTAAVILSSITPGAVTLNPGSSSFNILTINGAASTVYTLTTNNLSTAGNCNITSSELNLNGLTFNLGDNAGSDVLSIYGTLNVNANAVLKMGATSVLAVYSGGTVKIVGTSGNIATVTKQTGGSTYAFSVSSGGTIHAQYYLFEYMNVSGIVVNAGATINTTNNFSNGTFSNGFTNGKYLVLLNSFANYSATGVTFNSGPAYSCSRISGTGDITFFDPSGPLASYIYEEDDNSPTTGLILWSYSNPQLTWIGVTSTDWQDPTNWSTTGPPGPPDNTTDVTISSGTPFQPVLTANAATSDFTMASGSVLAMGAYDFNVKAKFSNNGGSFTTTGTVTLSASTGTNTVDPGTSSFYNLTIASTAGYSSSRAINVTNDFTIGSGSNFTIANAAHTLTIGNNWTSTGATFTHGNGTVIFNKNSGTCSLTTGAAGAGGATFYNLSVIQATGSPVSTKTQTLTGNLTVAGTFLVSSTKCVFNCGAGNTVNLTGTLTFGSGATLAGGSSTLNVTGPWLNNIGAPFSYGTSRVVFNGGATQSITRSTATGETFYNVTINNAAGITCAKPVVVYGQLTLTNGLVATTTSNMLTMAAGSTTSLGSATSYINGPMTYAVAADGVTSINLPIGKSTSWRPVGLTVTQSGSTSASYVGEMVNTSAKSLGYTLPGSIANVSLVRYWQIDRVGPANLTSASATMYFKSTGIADVVTDPTNLRIVKTNGAGTAWTDVGGTGSGSGTGSISSSGFTQFGKFTFGNATGGTNPLPVELVSFTGTPENNQVTLSWITMTETNNDYFIVEKSVDGIAFEVLTKVMGAGNSTYERGYAALDKQPVSGFNYYRLKQVDFNGEFDYSKIIMVNVGDPELLLTVYPNPVINDEIKVNVTGNEGEQVNVVLKDIVGRTYYNKVIVLGSGCNKIHINRDNSMPAGIYFVVATGGGKVFTQRIIVQ